MSSSSSSQVESKAEDVVMESTEVKKKHVFTLLSYHICNGRREQKNKDGKFRWENRQERIQESILDADADIVCLQELRDWDDTVEGVNNFITAISDACGYRFVIQYRNDSELSFAEAILWKPSVFSFIDSFLTKRGKGSNSSVLGAPSVTLKHIESGTVFATKSIHLEMGENEKTRQIQALTDSADPEVLQHSSLVAGDFNLFFDKDGDKHLKMLASKFDGTVSSEFESSVTRAKINGSFVGYSHDENKTSDENIEKGLLNKLDYVFWTPGQFKLIDATVDTSTSLVLIDSDHASELRARDSLPSDHLPVKVTLEILSEAPEYTEAAAALKEQKPVRENDNDLVHTRMYAHNDLFEFEIHLKLKKDEEYESIGVKYGELIPILTFTCVNEEDWKVVSKMVTSCFNYGIRFHTCQCAKSWTEKEGKVDELLISSGLRIYSQELNRLIRAIDTHFHSRVMVNLKASSKELTDEEKGLDCLGNIDHEASYQKRVYGRSALGLFEPLKIGFDGLSIEHTRVLYQTDEQGLALHKIIDDAKIKREDVSFGHMLCNSKGFFVTPVYSQKIKELEKIVHTYCIEHGKNEVLLIPFEKSGNKEVDENPNLIGFVYPENVNHIVTHVEKKKE